LRGLAGDSALVLAGDVARRVLKLAATLVLTRGLGPGMFGSFSLGLSLHNLGQQTARFGLPQAAVKFVSHHDALDDPARVRGVAQAATVLSVLFGAIVGTALVLGAPWLAESIYDRPELTGLLRLFGAAVALSAPGAVLLGVLQGARRFAPMVAIQSFAAPALLAGGYWLALRLEATPRSAATIFLAVAALQVLAAGAAVWWTVLRSAAGPAALQVRELLQFSLPMAVIDASAFGLRGLDIVLLGALLEPVQVGIYAAAQPIALLVPFALAPVRMVFAPRIAAAHARERTGQLRSALVMTTLWATLAGMALFGVLAAFDEPVMRLLGREFAAGAPVLLILAAGALVNCAVGAVGQVLIMTDRPWTVALDNLAVTALVAVGLPLAAPAGGAIAAAGVMALALAGVNLVRAWRVWREHGILPWDRRTALLWAGFAVGITGIFVARGVAPGMGGRMVGLVVFLVAMVTAAWPTLRGADEATTGRSGD
jgi:O-antigen/teichoic acid export membrane protein